MSELEVGNIIMPWNQSSAEEKKRIRLHVGILVACALFCVGMYLAAVYVVNGPADIGNVPPASYAHRWLMRQPCAAPCWEGITPGKTTPDDAVALLKANSLISSTSIIVYSPENTVTWSWIGDKGDSGHIITQPDNTSRIDSIRPGFNQERNDHFSLDEVITAYGPPSHVDAYVCAAGPDTPINWAISIIYENSGIELRTFGSFTPKPARIDGSLRFDMLVFHAVPYQPKGRLNLTEWKGFQNMDVYVDGRVVTIPSAC